MPSVGMRRSTRVFGARVLRSGRRLWMEPREGSKYMRAPSGGNEWINLLESPVHGGSDTGAQCKDTRRENEYVASMEVAELRPEEHASVEATEVKNADRMYGKVYCRKRKRALSSGHGLSEKQRFGIKFARRQWRKNCWGIDWSPGGFQPSVTSVPELAVFATSFSFDNLYWMSRILYSILRYMSKVRTAIPQLSAFLLSEPICGAYSSQGVHFLQDLVTVRKHGVCIISGCKSMTPLFVVDFVAIPFCFMDMHRLMHLRFARASNLLFAHPLPVSEKDESQVMDVVYDVEELSSSESPMGNISSADILAADNNDSQRKELSLSIVGPKPVIRKIELRKSRKIQKRKGSSLRRKRRKPAASIQIQKASGVSSFGFLKFRNDASQIPSALSTRFLRSSSDKKNLNADIKEVKSTQAVLPLDVCSSSCSANLLIIETDKCYREEGVVINLEPSASKHWFVSVMKEGVKRYALTAQKVMRPPCVNRFTHATVWTVDGGRKLEFPNKQDWLIFKELYKECSSRNEQAPTTTVIPVPGVQEVSYPLDGNYVPYVRPETYITVKDDELTRAMMKNCANYDIDSDDEQWLQKFNNELLAQTDHQDLITPERFELIIDAFEKGSHSHPVDFVYQTALDHLETKDALEAIHDYWSKKRKQRRSALVRIFQLYQPRRTQVIPKSVFRKKRSFKRRASQSGRGKQHTFLQGPCSAMAAERESFEQRDNLQKVQEAKAAADRSEELAVLKRQRAQMLMENADLATYKAMMAIRIAEATQLAKAPVGTVASFLIG